MKALFVTTITGPDRPGLLKSLAQKTRALGGEWLISKVIKLDGQLAAILRVSVDRDRESGLRQELEREFADLSFVYTPAPAERETGSKTMTFEIDCLDRPGLTRDLTNLLANLDIGVESMDATRFPLGAVSSTSFAMKVTLSVPRDTDDSIIAGEIEALSDEVRVRIV